MALGRIRSPNCGTRGPAAQSLKWPWGEPAPQSVVDPADSSKADSHRLFRTPEGEEESINRTTQHPTGPAPVERPGGNALTVLAVDGGGVRGLYSAIVLQVLQERFASQFKSDLDVGRGFDLIVGTSTGGILATCLAAGVSPIEAASLYRAVAPGVFPNPLPHGRVRRLWWGLRHLNRPSGSAATLQGVLEKRLGRETFGQLFERRGIGLCLPATLLSHHSPRVFKTRHLPMRDRDDPLRLVEAVMATSAAPIVLPPAVVGNSSYPEGTYVDGGLWGNSPVLVALLEALALASSDQPIVILSIGTCPPPPGDVPESLTRGVLGWGFGIEALQLSMDAQALSAGHMVEILIQQFRAFGKDITLLRCAESQPSAEQARILGLDHSEAKSLDVLTELAREDGNATFRWTHTDHPNGPALTDIFHRMRGDSHFK